MHPRWIRIDAWLQRNAWLLLGIALLGEAAFHSSVASKYRSSGPCAVMEAPLCFGYHEWRASVSDLFSTALLVAGLAVMALHGLGRIRRVAQVASSKRLMARALAAAATMSVATIVLILVGNALLQCSGPSCIESAHRPVHIQEGAFALLLLALAWNLFPRPAPDAAPTRSR